MSGPESGRMNFTYFHLEFWSFLGVTVGRITEIENQGWKKNWVKYVKLTHYLRPIYTRPSYKPVFESRPRPKPKTHRQTLTF